HTRFSRDWSSDVCSSDLHPRHACMQGVLPDWRARCFVRRAATQALEAVPLALTTAWFFPDRERVLLIYQGVAPLAEDDGADVDQIGRASCREGGWMGGCE